MAAVIVPVAVGILALYSVPIVVAIACAVMIVSFAAIGLVGGHFLKRAYQAKREKQAWTDAIQITRQERIRAAKEGFSYACRIQEVIFANKGRLRAVTTINASVSKAETEGLWRKDLASMRQQFHDHEHHSAEPKGKLVHEFFHKDLVNPNSLVYVFGNVPERYAESCKTYLKLNKKYRESGGTILDLGVRPSIAPGGPWDPPNARRVNWKSQVDSNIINQRASPLFKKVKAMLYEYPD